MNTADLVFLVRAMSIPHKPRAPGSRPRREAYITDGRNWWTTRRCKACGQSAVEIVSIGQARCKKCKHMESMR